MSDYDQHLFIEKGLRGGISMVSKHHAKANNPYLSTPKNNSHLNIENAKLKAKAKKQTLCNNPKSDDIRRFFKHIPYARKVSKNVFKNNENPKIPNSKIPNKISKDIREYYPTTLNTYIHYLDANNLYGWAMSQYLPIQDFEWDNNNIENDKYINSILNHPLDDNKGYILEVDLEYPKELHDELNSYPLAPESLTVKEDWLSTYQVNLHHGNEVEKLVPNLMDKTKYVLHYRNLQLYVKLGLRFKKIHRVLKFTQAPWMSSYIEMNTELRKLATTDFEKDLYKLMNNSVFGKTMENLRKRINVKLVRSSDKIKIKKLISSPSFNRVNIFDNDLVAIHMNKTKIKLNRPIYVGMSVLDLSKHLMYDFYYNDLKKQYGDKCDLLYTDTDSLLLEIKTKDIYKDMKSNEHMYDTSDYPTSHFLHSMKNKKVLGKMKDECNGKPISEYVGLKPKMYSILLDDGVEIKKAKGVKKYVVKKHISHNLYKEVLRTKTNMLHSMNSIRSIGHKIYSLTVNKISLSPFDSKRWISSNGIDTLAYGHYRIPSGGRTVSLGIGSNSSLTNPRAGPSSK